MRKYIAYARAYCHPVLSEEAKGVLQVWCGAAGCLSGFACEEL